MQFCLGEQISALCKYFEPIGSIFVWKIMEGPLAKHGENFRKICALITKKVLRKRASEIFDGKELTA